MIQQKTEEIYHIQESQQGLQTLLHDKDKEIQALNEKLVKLTASAKEGAKQGGGQSSHMETLFREKIAAQAKVIKGLSDELVRVKQQLQ